MKKQGRWEILRRSWGLTPWKIWEKKTLFFFKRKKWTKIKKNIKHSCRFVFVFLCQFPNRKFQNIQIHFKERSISVGYYVLYACLLRFLNTYTNNYISNASKMRITHEDTIFPLELSGSYFPIFDGFFNSGYRVRPLKKSLFIMCNCNPTLTILYFYLKIPCLHDNCPCLFLTQTLWRHVTVYYKCHAMIILLEHFLHSLCRYFWMNNIILNAILVRS